MTPKDQALLDELLSRAHGLNALLDRLAAAEFGSSCACVAGSMCAWHAGIADQIGSARTLLLFAAQAVEKGE